MDDLIIPDSFLSQEELQQSITGEQAILAYNQLEWNEEYSLQELISERPKTIENNQVNIEASASENNHESHQNKQTTCAQSKSSHSFSELEKFITRDVDIKIVCQSYEKNGYLTERGRKILIHNFIDKEKKDFLKSYTDTPLIDWPLDKEKFEKYAETIQKVFPGENAATYFSPFRIENKVRISASGKLKSHFDYVKGILRTEGLILPFTRAKNSTQSENCNLPEDISQKIKYLETHSDDLEKVKTFWADTYHHRKNILKIKGKTVDDYLCQFKGLKEKIGQELIEIDFRQENEGKENLIFENWPLIKDHLVNVLKSIRLTKDQKNYLQLLSTLQNADQDVVIFYLLIHLFPVSASKKRKRANERENLEPNEVADNVQRYPRVLEGNEKQESYMIVISIANEADATLENLKSKLYKQKLTLQPLVVVVGSIVNTKQIFVVINDFWYETKSFLNAVALAFKAFFVLDCCYPAKSKDLWMFIQRALFDIKILGEKVSVKVRTLEKQVENILKKST